MVRRYDLRDEQWERIKDLLPGRAETVGVTVVYLLKRLFIVIDQACHGETYPNVLAIGKMFSVGIADGLKVAFGRRYSCI